MRRSDVMLGGAGAVFGLALSSGGLDAALAALVGGSLACSRSYPRATWLFAAIAMLAAGVDGTLLGGEELVMYVLVAAHAFCSGRWDAHWKGLGGPIALAASAEVVAALEQNHAGPANGFFTFLAVAAWGGGRALREREQLVASLTERTAELAAEEEAYARLSVRYERARIAAELHDVVAHAISVMVIQAGAGQRLAASEPELTRDTFDAIASAAREAEGDLGRLVALLDDRDATADAPDLALVEELVARAAASGLDVRLRLEGDTETLPQPLVALAHRVVQEGVTNALRYASGSTVEVLVRGEPHAMLVEVANGPALADLALAGSGTGNGLRGLKERAASCGGTVQAGPEPNGGWRLIARLPRRASVGVA